MGDVDRRADLNVVAVVGEFILAMAPPTPRSQKSQNGCSRSNPDEFARVPAGCI